MTRLVRLVLLVLAAAACLPATALAAPRMWTGFQDDPGLRWRQDRDYILERAKNANATMVTASVEWSRIASRRPRRAVNPFDPAYNFENIDELVRGAQMRGLEVMVRISSTPRWAGPGRNRLPRRLSDLTSFATAVANGRIYAVGCSQQPAGITGSIESYDPMRNEWTSETPLPTPRYALVADVIDGVLYATSGTAVTNNGSGLTEALDLSLTTHIVINSTVALQSITVTPPMATLKRTKESFTAHPRDSRTTRDCSQNADPNTTEPGPCFPRFR